jgi:hypothetical protein
MMEQWNEFSVSAHIPYGYRVYVGFSFHHSIVPPLDVTQSFHERSETGKSYLDRTRSALAETSSRTHTREGVSAAGWLEDVASSIKAGGRAFSKLTAVPNE